MEIRLNKHIFKNIVTVMEKTLKEVNKVRLSNHFSKYAFTKEGVLWVTNGKIMIGIKCSNFFIKDNEEIKDNTAYEFKWFNYNKDVLSIELTEVSGVDMKADFNKVINFESHCSFDFNFTNLESWLAFNYRVGTFELEYLKTSFDIVKFHGTVTYSEQREMKVESDYAVFICLGRLTNGDYIKPKSKLEIMREVSELA